MHNKRDPLTPMSLVVEDEPLLRMMAADLAREAGFNVVEASNADEAMSILGGRADIRVLFTDIDLPGSLNGLKLASYVRDRWPPVGIIVVSGQLRPCPADLPRGSVFFPKPYNDLKVIASLRAFLDQVE